MRTRAAATGVLLGTLLAALGALLVLVFVFRSFMAIVPLLMALVAIPTTFLLVWPIASVTEVSVIVQFLVALIGLGIAIDYALLVVVRWREERQQPNTTNEAAVRNAMQHAGSAVVFSGTTVAISLLALLAVPIPALRSIGIAGLLIALVSVAVASRCCRSSWRRSARGSTGLALTATAVPAAAGRPGRGSSCATAGSRPRHRPPCWWRLSSPPRPSSSGIRAPRRSHRKGPHAPASRTCRTRASAPGRSRPSTRSSAQAIPRPSRKRSAQVEGVRSAAAPADWRREGTAVVVDHPDRGRELSSRPGDARPPPRAEALPAEVTIGGEAAQGADFLEAVYANFPLMLALISILTFILLARAFRSLILPLKAVLLNLLSVGAAWGLIVLVFQKGFGSDEIFGIEATQAINVEMPIVIFAFLFGISMDYQVFIISRMREAYDRTGSTETAVVEGIGRTGRLVTSAALILGLVVRRLRRPAGHRGQDLRPRARRRHPDRRHDHPRRPHSRRGRHPRPLELVAPRLGRAHPPRRAITARARSHAGGSRSSADKLSGQFPACAAVFPPRVAALTRHLRARRGDHRRARVLHWQRSGMGPVPQPVFKTGEVV